MNSGEEISGEFVVPCGDGAKVLEFVEEALDEIAFAVERVVTCTLYFTVGLGRDHGDDFPSREGVEQRIGIVSLVADQGVRIGAIDQRLRASQIVDLPWREHQFDRIAKGIDERVDFCRQPTAGSPDRLFAVFFRAPALCW